MKKFTVISAVLLTALLMTITNTGLYAQAVKVVASPVVNVYFLSGYYGDSAVHLVWENHDEANVVEVVVERSIARGEFKELARAKTGNMFDIHANYYPQDINYDNTVLYTTEVGHGRYIYNDVISKAPAHYTDLYYRIRMITKTGEDYYTPVIVSDLLNNAKTHEAVPAGYSNEDASGAPSLKSGPKPGCPAIETPQSGYTPTGQITPHLGTCCMWIEELFETGIIQIPCGGGSYAWCCNNVPGASNCQSGYVWDPCCVHYCNQYNQCSCHPWNCCNLTMVQDWVITTSIEYTPITLSETIVNETCTGMLNGSVSIVVNNAATPISYTWSNGTTGTPDLTGIGAGSYSVTVTDAHNCTVTGTYSVSSNYTPNVTLSGFSPVCANGTPFNLSGGSPAGGAYTGPGVSGGQFDPNSAGPGTHTISYTYTDQNGCTATATNSITVHPLPVVTLDPVTPMCVDAGTVNLVFSPAGGVFTGPGVTAGVFNPAVAGAGQHFITYSYTDGNQCSNAASQMITVYALPNVTLAPLAQACIDVAPYNLTGGNPAGGTYTGNGVSGGVFDPAAAGLGSHPITYTFTDANNCTNYATQNLTVNPMPVVNFASLADVCTSTQPFSLTAGTPSGGTYYGTGITGGNTFNPGMAGAGTYTITYIYTNSGACSDTGTQTITVNPTPTSTFTASSPLCSLSDTSLLVYTGTGTASAVYNWAYLPGSMYPGGTTQGPQHVTWGAPGIYTITLLVTENGCTSTPTVQTVFVSNIFTSMSVINDVSCFGGNDGSAAVFANNGVPSYHYLWNTVPPQTGATATGLTAGTYIVVVSDSSTCFVTDTVVVNQPALLEASLDTTTIVTCYGGNDGTATVSAVGGVMPYTYAWSGSASTGPVANGLSAGNHTVTVTDNKGCTDVVAFNITQNPQIVILLNPHDEGCYDECNGYITANVVGGVPPYTYQWSANNVDSSTVTNLCRGNYAVTVTDSKNCQMVSAFANIATNTLVNAAAIAAPVEGIFPCDISFLFTGSGASTYSWDFGDGSPNSSTQNPIHTYTDDGVFTVTLTINSGPPDFCEDKYSLLITIYEPSSVIIPNVFTPNGDGWNDEFFAKTTGLIWEKMIIYNRWGKKVTEWSALHGNWDGKTDGGADAADGVYYYIFTAEGFDKIKYSINGTVTLLR